MFGFLSEGISRFDEEGMEFFNILVKRQLAIIVLAFSYVMNSLVRLPSHLSN